MSSRKPDRARLSGVERKTYDALYRHPAPRDLAWGDVIAVLKRLAEVREDRKGRFQITRRGVLTTLKAPLLRLPLTADELHEVKSYLDRSEEGVSRPVVAEDTRLLVALDSGGARIYRLEFDGAAPQRLEPFESNGYAAYQRTRLGPDERAQPERLGFAKDLARALRGADEFLLIASGTDASTTLERLRADLRRADAELALRMLGPLVSPGGRTSEARLLETAREFYARRG
jgi:hypothetical protein